MACGGCSSRRAKEPTYVYTAKDGTTKVYTSKTEAQAKVRRSGGTWKEQ